MFFLKQTKKQRYFTGFTLLEAILYITIVAILLVAVIDFHLIMSNTTDKLLANIEASRNRRIGLESLDYLAKNSDDLLKDNYNDCSTFNSSPQVLALYFANDTYLPGSCVPNGGGVRITLENQRLKMNCYPNIPYNGWFNACSTSTYPAGNSYYLTSPEVKIINSGLSFSTSTATSTLNSFTALSSHLEVISLSGGQTNLVATSTATSTVVMSNKQYGGLISFFKFEEGSGTASADSNDSNTLTCGGTDTPTHVTGLVTGSSYALDFEAANSSSWCKPNSPVDPTNLNFIDAFTVAAWIKPETMSGTTAQRIFSKTDDSSKGWRLCVNGTNARVDFTIYDSSTSQITSTGDSTLANGSIYHVTAVYDYKGGVQKVFLYKKGVGQVATSTSPVTIPILVNYADTAWISSSTFDGIIDDLRFYNRALSNEEIWALQSQGVN
jgi:hypothetical protein